MLDEGAEGGAAGTYGGLVEGKRKGGGKEGKSDKK